MDSSPITPYAARVVSFSPKVRVKKTTHLKNYTKEEIANCWYSQKETKLIRAEAMQIAMVMQDESTTTSSNDVCTRGLDHLTLEGRRSKMSKRFQAWDAVLDEQELQQASYYYDDVSIACIYVQISFESSLAAIARGLTDQLEASEPEPEVEAEPEAVSLSNFVVVSPSTKKKPKSTKKKTKSTKKKIKQSDIPKQICCNVNKKQSSSSSSSSSLQSKLQPLPRQQLQQHCFDICSKVSTTTTNTTKTNSVVVSMELEDMILHSSSSSGSFWGPTIDEMDRVLSILGEVETVLKEKNQKPNTNTTSVII